MLNTVLVSGSNGFLGSSICRVFEQAGWSVLRANRNKGADVQIELETPCDLAKKIIDRKIDVFIHTAAANEVICTNQPYQAIYYNVAGTRAALEFSILNGIPRFVYISTFHVFGNPKGEITEFSDPEPANDYGLTHLQAEDYVRMYDRKGSISGLIVRPSNLFGIPTDLNSFSRWTLVPFDFCRQAVQDGKIVLRTPGTQFRNFVNAEYVSELIREYIEGAFNFKTLNIYGHETMTIRSLAALVIKSAKTILDIDVELLAPEIDTKNPIEFNFHSKNLKQLSLQPDQFLDLEKFSLEFMRRLTL